MPRGQHQAEAAEPDERQDRQRLDKWLWSARFFKTRSLAAEAVDAGRVQVNGERAKPARALKPGDRLRLRLGAFVHEITVLALARRRGPAAEAQALYRESEESRAAREQLAAQMRAEPKPHPLHKGRPTKRARRDLERFRRED